MKNKPDHDNLLHDNYESRSSSNQNRNTTGLLIPDPDHNWIGGVERRLLNKNLPQCQAGENKKLIDECEVGNQSKMETKAVMHEHSRSSGTQERQHDNDGIVIEVDAEDLDYVDDVPNPQEPENKRMEPLVLDSLLDDSDGLEQGATALSMMPETNQMQQMEVHLSREQWEEMLRKDPVLKSMLNQLLDERLKDIIPGGMPQNTSVDSGKVKEVKTLSKNMGSKYRKSKGEALQGAVIKSPSDTTIYALALAHRNTQVDGQPIVNEFVKSKDAFGCSQESMSC